MRIISALLLSVLAAAHPAFATDSELFSYDKAASLNVVEVGQEQRGGATVRDITFVGVKDPIKAYVVTAATPGPHAAILYVHWLGDPATTNRTEFLDEAVTLAGRGVVSLLVDTMWAKPKWYEDRVPEQDFDSSVRQVIELRRAMDLLLAQPGVDPSRVAYVGHDFGAMYGMIAGGLDRRAKTYVFMAGVPHFIEWALFAHQPKDLEAYKKQITPLDPVNFVPNLAPATVFFQFANKDEYVSATQAAEAYAAAPVRKQLVTYADGHALHTPAVAADRVAWLERELGLTK